MDLGNKISDLRKKENLSQEKLAEKIGVSRQSVSKWENGTAYPEMNRIFELCKIFHCKLNDLVNDNILDFDSLDKEVKNKHANSEAAKEVGALIAKRAQDKKIKTVVFDRSGYLYHGIIKDLAEAAREAGL